MVRVYDDSFYIIKETVSQVVVVVGTPVIPALWEARDRRISEFEASLVYRVSSRTPRAIQRNPVSEKKEGIRGG